MAGFGLVILLYAALAFVVWSLRPVPAYSSEGVEVGSPFDHRGQRAVAQRPQRRCFGRLHEADAAQQPRPHVVGDDQEALTLLAGGLGRRLHLVDGTQRRGRPAALAQRQRAEHEPVVQRERVAEPPSFDESTLQQLLAFLEAALVHPHPTQPGLRKAPHRDWRVANRSLEPLLGSRQIAARVQHPAAHRQAARADAVVVG